MSVKIKYGHFREMAICEECDTIYNLDTDYIYMNYCKVCGSDDVNECVMRPVYRIKWWKFLWVLPVFKRKQFIRWVKSGVKVVAL